MKKCILLLMSLSTFVNSKELGIVGHTFDIAEQDMLYFIKSKLQNMQASGKIEEKNKENIWGCHT